MNQKFNFEKELFVVSELDLIETSKNPVVIFKAVEVTPDGGQGNIVYHVFEESPHARSTFKYVKKGLRVMVVGDFYVPSFTVDGTQFQRNCINANKVMFLEFPKEMREQKAQALFQKHASKLV